MRWDVINSIVAAIKAKSYLEIGLADGDTFKRIKCETKYGVDPDMQRFYKSMKRNGIAKSNLRDGIHLLEMNSDKAFDEIRGIDFDIVFIDGLHKFEQVKRDINNSLPHIGQRKGVIVLHDTLPPDDRFVTDKPTLKSKSGNWLWSGDVWRIFSWLGMQENLSFWTVDVDYGCTVIIQKPRSLINTPDDWDYFNSHRRNVARITSIENILSNKLLILREGVRNETIRDNP